MAALALGQILDLVGKLDDSPGEDQPRERFRRFLRENVREVGMLRDYVEECLRTSGPQYNRALQDLVNHLGTFLGFEVTFGRYQGVPGQAGHDGLWVSPTGHHIVVEVKTTEAYAIKTATLVGYVDALISEGKIPNWDHALGLYVVGRPDPEVRQLENAIIAEKRTHQLRIISAESLLSLAEMMDTYEVRHEDILSVLRPSGPTVDTLVDLMTRLVAGTTPEISEPRVETETPAREALIAAEEGEPGYGLAPVRGEVGETAAEVIGRVVGRGQVYAFGENTPGRKHLKPGDWMCFYATGTGVVAHARVASAPQKERHPSIRHPEDYPWVFHLKEVHLYLENPVIIDRTLRERLDAFQGRDLSKNWAWFVQATRRLTRHDFELLTRQGSETQGG